MEAQSTTLTLPIDGMNCASCVAHVEKALAAVPGVAAVAVNLATARASVRLSDPAARATLAKAVEKAGYAVPTETVSFDIAGMSCASCVAHVEKAIRAVPGVADAAVNLATASASVTRHRAVAADGAVESAVAKAGYDARLRTDSATGLDPQVPDTQALEAAALGRRALTACVLALPIFVLEMGAHLVPAMRGWITRDILDAVFFALTTVVLFGPGWRFVAVGVPMLLRGTPDMNALVAVGTLSAYGYSSVAAFAPDWLPAGTAHVYFEAASVIVALVLVGRYLEALSRGRTSLAIKRLVGLQPQTASVERDGVFGDVPLGEVRLGDRIQMRPGARVPVDGVVRAGESHLDESMLTGEPMPVFKQTGASVVGGTLNTTGSFVFEATKIGADTLLAQILRMVEDAQAAKLPIQALVDRVTAYFVPAIFAAAAATFLLWALLGPAPASSFALANAVAVLIVACPCAMGLATPTSILVGTGRAAELGILFKRGTALQTLRAVRVVAFDKTGTLTIGKPALENLVPAPGFARASVLAAVAAVEASSEHPLASAIVAAARAEGIAPAQATAFRAVPGMGLGGQFEGVRVEIGADRYMASLGIAIDSFAADAAAFGKAGKTPLYAAIDGKLAALLAVADPIRPEAAAAIRALQALGLKTAMVTGDNAATAAAVAARLGIDHVTAETLPRGKREAVEALRATFGAVAFVGDGINDAPALAEADVGIAVGTGTDIAVESAALVLMSGDLGGVVRAIALSKATMRNIEENLFWAFAYNTALVPVAAGALYPAFGVLLSPMLAAAAMGLSSVFVVANALRLRKFAA